MLAACYAMSPPPSIEMGDIFFLVIMYPNPLANTSFPDCEFSKGLSIGLYIIDYLKNSCLTGKKKLFSGEYRPP